ncbi:MAG: EamA family transporter RarD [Oceanicola sp.]|nr:EamA family transporter RarD [Oceanicola sp.]
MSGFRGIPALIAAGTIWGLSPLYYKLLEHVPPAEVLAHRTVWSFIFFALLLFFQGRLGQLVPLVRRQWRWIALASIMISVNWFLFIYAIQVDRVIEASLGYYIFPLVAVAMGRLVFKERLGALQWIAVALAVLAVSVLTVGLQVVPAISLVLATTFGLYGVIKKQLDAGPVLSVTAEVFLLLPLFILTFAYLAGTAQLQATSARDITILMCSGPLTAGPLILFTVGARRVRMATVGLVQYINPTLQFSCAVIVFGEPFTRWHAIAFSLIWVALALYSFSAFGRDRSARKNASEGYASQTG